MRRISRYLAILVLILGVVSMAMGIGFVVQGQAKADFIKEAMQQEQITLGLSQEQQAEGELVDSAAEALKTGDTIREHRLESIVMELLQPMKNC